MLGDREKKIGVGNLNEQGMGFDDSHGFHDNDREPSCFNTVYLCNGVQQRRFAA
jgi:hypothetical protein